MKFNTSKDSNPNYLAKIIKIKGLRKHENADRLQCITVDGNNIVTGMDTKEEEVFVYFPAECSINSDFLSYSNSYEDTEKNADKSKKGFFNKHGRVRVIKLRGEKSEGYIIPLELLEKWVISIDRNYKPNGITGYFSDNNEDFIDLEFDSIGETLVCKKYVNINKNSSSNGHGNTKRDTTAKISKLVDNQFRFHIDTTHLGKNYHKLRPTDFITITNKLHGSSFIVSKLICKKKLNWFEKGLKKLLKVNIVDTHYDFLHASRRVIKNEHIMVEGKNHYYKYDIWADIAKIINPILLDGMTIYGEVVGFTKNGEAIQKGYDYGCEPNKFETYVYRITYTNPKGDVMEFTTSQLTNFCKLNNLSYVPILYWGYAADLFKDIPRDGHWNEEFFNRLTQEFLEKDCDMCVNNVPAEGIVLRVDDSFDFEAYKHKSFKFREYETKQLDKGESNMEDEV